MMMTRRDWWIGIAVLALALFAHAVIPQYLPRYKWDVVAGHGPVTVDRWTGTASFKGAVD